MPFVCRTVGCAATVAGALGYCPVCHGRYVQARADGDRLVAAARRRYWELFACLEEPQARRLAEHLVGHARIGRRSVMFAVADFVAEAHEPDRRAVPTMRDRRPILRLMVGGGA
jgi:hypothetical protein